MNGQGQEAPTMVPLMDVLWIPGLGYRMLMTGTIRRDGGEFVDAGEKESYLEFKT